MPENNRPALPLAYLTLEAPRVGQASHVHVTEIIAGLERRNWNVRLHQPYYTEKPTKPGVAGRLLAYALTQFQLFKQWRRGGAIYVRSHFMALPTALLAKLLSIPIVHEVNGPYTDIFVTYPWLRRFRGLLEKMQRIQYRWADHLLPVTPDLASWLAQESGHNRITVIPNGANTTLFHPRAPRPADLPDGDYVVFFGGLARWHGVDTMIKAVESDVWPDRLSLVVIGDGQEGERLRQAAAGNPRLHALGYRPYEQIAGYVASSIGGLVPISNPSDRSSTGLFPLKVFETLACGVPAIVTDFPGQADLIRDNDCGLVIPPDSPGALAAAVATLASDPAERQRMGRRGAQTIQAGHSWDCRAGSVDTILRKLRKQFGG